PSMMTGGDAPTPAAARSRRCPRRAETALGGPDRPGRWVRRSGGRGRGRSADRQPRPVGVRFVAFDDPVAGEGGKGGPNGRRVVIADRGSDRRPGGAAG